RTALKNLRDGNPTIEDWRLLTTRITNQVPNSRLQFKDAIRIYTINNAVNNYNYKHLDGLVDDKGNLRPIRIMKATGTGRGHSKVSSRDAGSLEMRIPLGIGARIMLLENLWVSRSLVNGSIGTIDDIIWEEGADWRSDPPLAICVAFDGYIGPAVLYYNDVGQPVVPIFRSTREFFKGNEACTRTQFPLSIAFAITIHRAQGVTLDQVVLDISGTEFTAGLNYVAVSRVKSKEGLLFDTTFD